MIVQSGISGSRVSLESVLYHYKAGATPEQIACKFPSLKLADIYSVVAYYLNHRESVDEYLREAEVAGGAMQAQIESELDQHAEDSPSPSGRGQARVSGF
jgi:uncharacterized protein (DUF433 family)